MRTLAIVLFTGFFCLSASGQTPDFIEHFDYASGSLANVTTNWVNYSGTSGEVKVTDTDSDGGKSLFSSGYQTPSGLRIIITSSQTEDIGRALSAPVSSGSVSASFLIKVVSKPTASGTYFFNFLEGTGSTIFGGTLWIRSSDPGFQLGINARTTVANTQWLPTVLDLNKTHLVVVRYTFNTGSGNDIASLWVNPAVLQPEPAADISHTNTGGTDLTNISRVGLREATGMGSIEIDEMRVGSTWADAPLHVTLSKVTAAVGGGKEVVLSFATASEMGLAGFNIMRSSSPTGPFDLISSYTVNPALIACGGVASGGSYTFTDARVLPGQKYYYRIQGVDKIGTVTDLGNVTEVIVEAPGSFDLYQNTPNPFNPSTVISFHLPDVSTVTLKVYDISGREVAVLVDGVQSAGIHNAIFNGARLSSGIYFCRLHAETSDGQMYVATRKMILVK